MVLLLLLSLLLMPDEAMSACDAAGKATVIDGDVAVRKAGTGKGRPFHVGDALCVSDILETGKKAKAQVVLTDESSINISSDTALRINQYAFDAKNNRRTAVVRVLKGKTRFTVFKERDDGSAFKVEGGYALIGVALADFVSVVSPDETSVAVLDGGASVTNSAPFIVGEVNLGTNQMTVVMAKTPPSKPTIMTSQQRRLYGKDAHHF